MKSQNFALKTIYTLIPALIVFVLVMGIGWATAASSPAAAPAQQGTPLAFVENVGQFADGARFQAHSRQGTIWLADDALWITSLSETGDSGANVRLTFAGSNPAAQLEPFGRMAARVSYLRGADPAGWQGNVPVWSGIRYRNLYPGVDLEVTSENGTFVWRLMGAQPAALSNVRLNVEGAESLAVADGNLLLATAAGSVTLPLIQANGTSSLTPSVVGAEVVAPFVTGTSTDAGQANQVMEANQGGQLYGTFVGGTGYERGRAIAIDDAGNAYITGETFSADFPTITGAYSTTLGGLTDAFVAKLSADGSSLGYATFLGGSTGGLGGIADDYGTAIEVDSDGNAVIGGYTYADNFPIAAGTYQATLQGNSDAFIAKLDATGTTLLYSTYLGGSDDEGGSGVDATVGLGLDDAGNIYLAGATRSSNFPATLGAYDETWNGNYDAFIAKLNPAGGGASDLVYATFLGGTGPDRIEYLAGNGEGVVTVTGNTSSVDFDTTAGAYDESYNGESDAFVASLSADGSTLLYSTYLGGSLDDRGQAVAVDAEGNAYTMGLTYSSADFPVTVGAFDTTMGGDHDAYVAKVVAGGSALDYATFLGGSAAERGQAIMIDDENSAYVVGHTTSENFPTTPGAFDTIPNGGDDAFVAKLSPAGDALDYGSFIGGADLDRGFGLVVDDESNMYITGLTQSVDFPTTAGAYDITYNDGGGDAFVIKLGGENAQTLFLPAVYNSVTP